MQNALAILKLLEGKKTYLAVALAGLLIFGSWQHWWVIPQNVYTVLEFAALAFIRMGVSKAVSNSASSSAGVSATPMNVINIEPNKNKPKE